MMIIKKAGVLCLGVLLPASCAPMEQSSLIYVSAAKVGVNVSTTATSAGGIDVTIGVNQMDAAYVPVAAAKKCTSELGQCESDIYKVLPLAGNSDKSDGVAPAAVDIKAIATQYDAASSKLEEDNKALATAQATYAARKKAFDALPALTSDRDAKQTALNAIQDQASPDGMTASSALTAAQQKVTDAQSAAGGSLTQAELEQLQRNIAQLGETVKGDQIAKDGVLAKLQAASNSNQKRDAFSVFGIFNGDANAGVTSNTAGTAGVKLGKTFSTGVAAQNLTEGLANSSAATALASCLDSMKNLVAAGVAKADKVDLGQLAAICGSKAKTASNTVP